MGQVVVCFYDVCGRCGGAVLESVVFPGEYNESKVILYIAEIIMDCWMKVEMRRELYSSGSSENKSL